MVPVTYLFCRFCVLVDSSKQKEMTALPHKYAVNFFWLKRERVTVNRLRSFSIFIIVVLRGKSIWFICVICGDYYHINRDIAVELSAYAGKSRFGEADCSLRKYLCSKRVKHPIWYSRCPPDGWDNPDKIQPQAHLTHIILNILGIVNILGRVMVCVRWSYMISYAPFYRTLLEKGVTEYHLIYKQGFSANILHRMKHGKTITLKTLDTLCFILNCSVSDIIEYIPDE